jgi:hypothetical protein
MAARRKLAVKGEIDVAHKPPSVTRQLPRAAGAIVRMFRGSESEGRKNLLFANKKKQKNFHSALRALAAPAGAKPRMKVFARFFQKAPLPSLRLYLSL